MAEFPAFWLRRGPLSTALQPFAWGYRGVVGLRRLGFRRGYLRSAALRCPVIVVGNVFVGRTGKTPMVIWLAERLRARGRRPGIVTRGYGGSSPLWPVPVTAASDPRAVGDEPVLLAQRSGCPVVAGPDRVAAANMLLETADCDVIVSDDGLQHYRLQRDLELVVVDGERGLGNGRLLPAGPLREPPGRLAEVDMVIANGVAGTLTPYSFELALGDCRNLADGSVRPLTDPVFAQGVHALAGIGNPQRFFRALRAQGLAIVEHPFPDHHPYRAADLELADAQPVLMTEKDAVKCRPFAADRHWYVPVEAVLQPAATERLDTLLDKLLGENS